MCSCPRRLVFEPLGQDKFHEPFVARLEPRLLFGTSTCGVRIRPWCRRHGDRWGDAVFIRNDDDRLQLWPFPQQVPVGSDRAALWRDYRERMISHAGVCVVLAGNKLVGRGAVVLADGSSGSRDCARPRQTRDPSWCDRTCRTCPLGRVSREADYAGLRNDAKRWHSLAVLGDEASSSAALADAIVEILRALEGDYWRQATACSNT